MQFQNNLPYTCLSELEKLAYKVQSQWLVENGRKDVYEELEISPLWVFIITNASMHRHDLECNTLLGQCLGMTNDI
jgi:hypothetical protein